MYIRQIYQCIRSIEGCKGSLVAGAAGQKRLLSILFKCPLIVRTFFTSLHFTFSNLSKRTQSDQALGKHFLRSHFHFAVKLKTGIGQFTIKMDCAE